MYLMRQIAPNLESSACLRVSVENVHVTNRVFHIATKTE